jgi:hypothetical protein
MNAEETQWQRKKGIRIHRLQSPLNVGSASNEIQNEFIA